MFLGFAWAGSDRAEGEAVINRLRTACSPDVAVLDPTRWLAFQSAFDSAMPKGVRAYWRNASFDRFDGPMIETLVEHCGAQDWVGTAAACITLAAHSAASLRTPRRSRIAQLSSG